MAHPDQAHSDPAHRPGHPLARAFSEKSFYLLEFRGQTLVFAVPPEALAEAGPLLTVLRELAANGTRSVIVSSAAPGLARAAQGRVVDGDVDLLETRVWRELREAPRVGIELSGAFAPAAREVTLRLGVPKLVWIDAEGGLVEPDGRRVSFMDLRELQRWVHEKRPHMSARRHALLAELERLVAAGVPAVNLCSLERLDEELFTYTGSGTLFTRERYVTVRRLAIDDFDAADDLIARGVAEGYLAPRSREEVDRILAAGFGAFVESRHLAGVGALQVRAGGRLGEICSLYTLTRFLGEGIGGHLVQFAVERARSLGLGAVFACTTSKPVGAFFQGHGFREVSQAELPDEKWRDYDPERRSRLYCWLRSLDDHSEG